MLSNSFADFTNLSSKLVAQLAQAAKKGTADALQIAAIKLGEYSESMQDSGLLTDEEHEPCQLIDGVGVCQDITLHLFFEKLGLSRHTPYLIISIMGSQSGGKSTLLNHMVGDKALHTVLISSQVVLCCVSLQLASLMVSRIVLRSGQHIDLSCLHLAVWDQVQRDGSKLTLVWPKYSWHVG